VGIKQISDKRFQMLIIFAAYYLYSAEEVNYHVSIEMRVVSCPTFIHPNVVSHADFGIFDAKI